MPERADEHGEDCRCSSCDSYHPYNERHHWRWWEVAPMLMLAGITIGGWVWFLSGDHATAADLARRVTNVEDVQRAQAHDLVALLQSQTRVEAALEYIKESLILRNGLDHH